MVLGEVKIFVQTYIRVEACVYGLRHGEADRFRLAIFMLVFGGFSCIMEEKNLSFYSEYMEIKTMEFMTVKRTAEKW